MSVTALTPGLLAKFVIILEIHTCKIPLKMKNVIQTVSLGVGVLTIETGIEISPSEDTLQW